MDGREPAIAPNALVVLRRSTTGHSSLFRCAPEDAARWLAGSTYSAGELRRYWAFAAMLALGTGVGPAHPPVDEVATAFAYSLPCFTLALGTSGDDTLARLLDHVAVAA